MTIMNKYIKQLLSLAAVAMVSWGCEADFYNEHMIDGYEKETEIVDVQSIDYTLTEDDYSTISKNTTNKTNAEAAGQEAVDALAAIGKNKYFSTADEAAAYIPPFLASAYPTLDNNSIVMVTYTTALDIPEEVVKMNAATEYTLSEDNYKTIWESEEDFVKAVTPATISKVKSVLPSEGLEAGDYVAVTYNYSAEEPKSEEEPENPEQPEDPVQPEKPEVTFPGEGKYLIVAISETANYAVTPLVADKKYGYPTATEVTIAENSITADDTTNALAWTVTATSTEGEYTIQAPDARYYYLSGTFNSFNVSDTAGTDGYGFSFTPNEDGTFAITNVTMTKSLQYDSNYSSFGCYPDIRGIVPHIFVLNEAGTAYEDVSAVVSTPSTPSTPVYQQVTSFDGAGQYLMVAITETANYAATPLAAEKNYGYPTGTALTIENGTIAVDDTSNSAAWTVTATSTEGQYTLQGTDGRYHYLSGTYNSFNASADAGTDGYGFTFTANGDGTFSVTNVTMSKTLQYDPNYSSFGCYPDSRGIFVTLFKLTGNVSATASMTSKAASVTSEKKYAYFKWNGTSFEDTEIVAVQPSDYTEMGQNYGNFTNPAQDQYLPKFLGKTYPYAMEGDVAYVAYRCYAGGATSWKVDEYVSDGSTWNKTIYFAEKTDQFRKTEGAWAIDRTLELDYTGNGADTKAFYQYCVNWVYDNKDVPLGAPARDNAGVIVSTDIVTINGSKPAGNFWVSNYGNNEFYTGASAYYGNMDWRASACKGGFVAAGMGDLSDDEIVAKLKENTAEVFAAVLGYVYPEMTPEEYKKVVIKVYAYGPNVNYSYTFDVTGKGTFAYAEGSMTEL